jgi:hypothetical protein
MYFKVNFLIKKFWFNHRFPYDYLVTTSSRLW